MLHCGFKVAFDLMFGLRVVIDRLSNINVKWLLDGGDVRKVANVQVTA